MTTTATQLIEALELTPHPEGGWFKETWRADAANGQRAGATLIHFLLEAGQRSHWHRVDATEIWLWHGGDPLTLSVSARDEGPTDEVTLGPDVLAGQTLQHIIAPHAWQAALPQSGGAYGYSLVSCAVAPAFEFSGFTLAAPDWAPGCGRAPI